jgi:hypothetical protein
LESGHECSFDVSFGEECSAGAAKLEIERSFKSVDKTLAVADDADGASNLRNLMEA